MEYVTVGLTETTWIVAKRCPGHATTFRVYAHCSSRVIAESIANMLIAQSMPIEANDNEAKP